jgi:lipopolysaccharide transport system permease protein
MVGVIEGFRWCLLGGTTPVHGWSIVASLVIVLAVGLSGIAHFRRTERSFADVI